MFEQVQVRTQLLGGSEFPRPEIVNLLESQSRNLGAGPLAIDHIRRLIDPRTVAVVSYHRPQLFGGPLATLLKALTVVKLSETLKARGISCVPIASVLPDCQPGQIHLLNREYGLVRLSLDATAPAGGTPGERVILPAGISDLVAQVRAVTAGNLTDAEALGRLEETYLPGRSLSEAFARHLSGLFEEWGLVVLDAADPGLARLAGLYGEAAASGCPGLPPRTEAEALYRAPGLPAGRLLPVAAEVADPEEIAAWVDRTVPPADSGPPGPVRWGRSSATLVDRRSGKTMEKYGLRLPQLLSGADAILALLHRPEGQDPIRRLQDLGRETSRILGSLSSAVPPDELKHKRALELSEARILYQLEKLSDKFSLGRNRKSSVMRTQILRLCNSVAPMGGLQERTLGLVHFVARYSTSCLRFLYSKLEPGFWEHQMVGIE